ncbi:MAG: histidine kinase [Candidatus Altiarchaeota archaeon]|nr:histidine kinase [Candidatus Altiarchaeota archaeon]
MAEDEYIRPSPEELLKRISAGQKDETKGTGSLTIFFGYAPGVGKTYAMLCDAASRKKDDKLDVVAGYVEPHKRPETKALASEFETIKPAEIEYHGLTLAEPDTEAIIKRNPRIALMDELAHTNAPGTKNAKRYEDVQDVLNAGIDVYTTLNVQHIESLKEVVFNITGTLVKENVPDSIFLNSENVKLVDLPIDQLLNRLKEGKVYTRDMATEAVQKFFRPGNLLALRQAAMQQMALHIGRQMERCGGAGSIETGRRTSEKFLVCISPSPNAGDILRSAYRLSAEHEAELIAIHVETGDDKSLNEDEKKWLKDAFDTAGSLGVRAIRLNSNDVTAKITSFAVQNAVTMILMGKPRNSRKQKSVDDMLAKTDGIDLYVYAAKRDGARQ